MDAFVVSHASALKAIRTARCRCAALPWDGLTRSQQRGVLGSCAPNETDIDFDALGRLGIWDPEVCDPIDVLVGDAAARRRAIDLHPHVVSRELPSKSLLAASGGIYSCSPALVCAQVAENQPWQAVLALAMELCGTFSLEADGGQPGYRACEPALSVPQLVRYLAYAKQIHGLPTARKAAGCALDGAASPMEAIVAALYHVPMSMGGFGIDGMLLNHRVEFTRDAVLASGMPYAVLDAYIPEASATLEYNGHYHDAGRARIHDERRSVGLQAMGIQTIPLNDEQLRDIDALEAVAKILYKRMGKRFRYRIQGYRPKQEELLNTLRRSMGLKPC